ncbi:MAG: Stf0 family sulfotransferase [Gallionellaceae bacterium]
MNINPHPERNPELDRHSLQSPSFRYAVFSQQRSGSNWLCARLSNLREFGIPAEYLNGHFSPDIAKRLLGKTTGFDFPTYLAAVECARSSPGGRFGIKIQPHQLFALVKNDMAAAANFLKRYDALILLTRQDKLAQAVSGAIAQLTVKWRTDGQEPDLSSVNNEQLICELASKLARYLIDDSHMILAAEASQRPMLHITYEQMESDPDGTLDRVVRFLGHKEGLDSLPVANVVSVPEPTPGKVAAELRQLFLDFIEGRRSVRQSDA